MPNNLVAGSAMGNGATQAPPAPGNALVRPPMASPTPPKQVHLSEVKDVVLKQATIDRALKDLLKEPGPVKRGQVVDMAVSLVAKQVMSPQAMAGYLADLPEDGMQIRQWAAQHAKNVEQGLDQLLQLLHGAAAPQTAPPQ
jgi:hypothetical protein